MSGLRQIVLALLSALALMVLGSIAATAASPRALPSGNSLYAFDCQSAPFGEFLKVDVATFEGTLVAGSGSSDLRFQCAFPGAINPVNGDAYWISAVSPTESYLMKANLSTGVSTVVAQTTLSGNAIQATSMAIDSNGAAYAISVESTVQNLYSLDLATGALTSKASLTGGTLDRSIYSFAFNPKNALFYLQGTRGKVYRVDVATGALTTACTFADTSAEAKGFSFDQNGIAWFVDGPGGGGSIDVTAVDCAPESIGALKLSGTDWYSQSPLVGYPVVTPTVAPSPSPSTSAASGLPATGQDVAGFIGFAALAGGIGISLLIVTLRRPTNG